MSDRPHHIPCLDLLVPRGALARYTSLLQAGIINTTAPTTTVGAFLASLPGFSENYINTRIETIFLNGLPLDDLTTVIKGPLAVLAVSGAMPGLAGAILRKNSFHAHLRTTTPHSSPSSPAHHTDRPTTLLLKVFNVIAAERGPDLLNKGCTMNSDSILAFFAYRPDIHQDIIDLKCDGNNFPFRDLHQLLQNNEQVFLRIHEDNDTPG